MLIPDGVDPAAAAPILCAGVTVYKGLKVTDIKPGQWVLVSGIGGLGHIAVQYAVAMGLPPQAVAALRRGGTGLPGRPAARAVPAGHLHHGARSSGPARTWWKRWTFFARGLITRTYTARPMEDINEIFAEMGQGRIDGRAVMSMAD